MKNFENIEQNNIIEEENELLNPNKEMVDIMSQTMSEYFEKDKNWEAIIVANEMALSGINTKKLFKEEYIKKAQNELQQLRIKIKENNNPDEYIDLARLIYRFQNLNINFPNLDKEEQEKLKNLPEYIRNNPNYPKEQLAYIPQIANAAKQDIETLKKPNDAKIIRKKIELDIENKKENDSQFHSMIINGGLLAQFDSSEAKKLTESDIWKDGKEWQDILNYFKKIKEEKNGWYLSRLLPQIQSLIKLKREN
jgi:hypothetical protein